MKEETISILGCGWYGLALAQSLIGDGYQVKGSTTRKDKMTKLTEAGIIAYQLNLADEDFEADLEFFICDVLIISIPPRNKNDKSIDYYQQIKKIISFASEANVKNIIFISSTGIYQDGNFIIDENTLPEPTSENGKLLMQAETLLQQTPYFCTTIIRFGGLIGPDRNLAKYFTGKTDIKNGLAPINLIHLQDSIGLTKTILQKQAFGTIYHGVAPSHPTRANFYTQACIDSGFEKPEFIAELMEWKQIESVNVPSILGYKWKVIF